MVSFLNSHAPSLPRMSLSRWEEVRTTLSAHLNQLIRHILRDPLLFIWQFLTAPLWLGSGIPLPGYPTTRTTTSTTDTRLNASFDGSNGPDYYLDEQIRSLSRRFWLAGIGAAAFRGFTIGTIICTIWAIGGLRNITSDPYLSGLLALMITGALLGAAFGFVTRPTAMRVATMLDRTFHLDERLTTAFDPTLSAGAVIPTSMRRLQLADAANGFAEIRGDVRGAAVLPVREAVIAVLAAICLVTALLFSIAGNQIPTTSNAVVPAFVPSSERFVRQQQELEAQQQAKQRASLAQSPKPSQNADEQGKATKDLSSVGAALKDQPITKSASDSITSGDYSGASKSLHENAAAAKNLPQDQRNALAGKLDKAASAISPDNKDLASSSKQAAADLRAGGDQATQGLNSLADQIDKTGKKASPNQATGAAQPNSSAAGSNSNSSQQQSQASQQGGSSPSKQPASSNTSDPGSGMAAQPGIGSEPQQNPAGQSASQQKSGSAAGSGQSSQAQAGSGGSPGSQQAGQQAGTGTGQSSTSASNSSGQSAQSKGSDSSGKSGASSNPASGANSSQQAGTGGGAGQTNGTNQNAAGQNNPGSGASTNQPAGKSDTAGNGKAGNPPPGNNNTGSNSGNPPSAQSGDQSLVLQGTSNDNSVGTGNDIGSSSSGSGSGSGVASGNATQGKVGPAGPDSNHVPDAYRDIVKGYFDGDGTTP